MLLKKYDENYGYLNARLRARMEFFLKRKDYLKLVNGDLYELEALILEGQFGENYREELLQSHLSLEKRIDEALARGVASNFQRVKAFAVGEPRLLLELLLMRADLHNGRLLLRALKTESNKTQKAPKWYAFGALPVSLLEELWDCKSNKEIIGKLLLNGHKIAICLARAVMELEQTGVLPQAERKYLSQLVRYAMDKIEDITGKNKKIILEYIHRTIDIWNFNVFSRKSRRNGEDAAYAKYFMDVQGLIERSRLFKATSWENLLVGTPWARVLKSIGVNYDEHVVLRNVIREFLFWQIYQRRKDLMGIGVAIAYIAMQLVEWQNLNTISVGLQIGMSSDQILSRLILLER